MSQNEESGFGGEEMFANGEEMFANESDGSVHVDAGVEEEEFSDGQENPQVDEMGSEQEDLDQQVEEEGSVHEDVDPNSGEHVGTGQQPPSGVVGQDPQAALLLMMQTMQSQQQEQSNKQQRTWLHKLPPPPRNCKCRNRSYTLRSRTRRKFEHRYPSNTILSPWRRISSFLHCNNSFCRQKRG